MVYQVKMDDFEGPLELLIHLIEKEKMDISTVSIYLVIDEYLSYVRHHVLCVNEGSCFLYMASVLMYIKSMYLLPRSQEKKIEADEDLQAIELRLLEYKKIKEAQKKLEERREVFQKCYRRGEQMELNFKEDVNYRVNVYQLAKRFAVIIKKKQFVHKIENRPQDKVTMEDRILDLRRLFSKKERVIFDYILDLSCSRLDLICIFLALLELIKQQFLGICYVEKPSSLTEVVSVASIWIVKKENVG